MADNVLTRFFGGPPALAVARLVFASLIVGAILVWLDIRPPDILAGFRSFAEHLWGMGFGVVREAAQYVIAGAVIVIPAWLVLRLLSMRGSR